MSNHLIGMNYYYREKDEEEEEQEEYHEEEQQWNKLHILIVVHYFSNLSTTCDFPELTSAKLFITDDPWVWRWDPHLAASFEQDFMDMFVVPRLNKFHQTQNRIHKFHLIEAFLTLLLQFLYHKKAPPIVTPSKLLVEILEKELRYLLTILGDITWREGEFRNLLPQFEAVANQAGSFVHSFFFSNDQAILSQKNKAIAAVLERTDLLKANLESRVATPAPPYTTQTSSIVDSILFLDSLVDDLEDLLKRDDDPIADVKDQVSLLHHDLQLLNSSINDMRSPQPSEIEELKEPLMRLGGIAHQAEYLITAFLVKDAPLWYVFNRLTQLNQNLKLLTTKILVITQKYQCGGLKVAEYYRAELPLLHDKRNTEINDVTVGIEDKTTEILYQLVGGGSQSLQVISILGMAGLGKTTLASKLYNHLCVSYRFDKLAWCVVSQSYNTSSIFANILIHINSELDKDRVMTMKEMNLVEHIHKTLMGRRYLIVVDDIWDLDVLDELLRCFPDGGNGSRVLVTSRNKGVAPPNSIKHELPLLTDEQCWELLEKKVFGSRACCPQLQGIGKKIAAKCCGLPLTVVVIAGVLSSVDEEERTWEEVGGSLALYIDGEDNSVMRILEMSYKHLPDHLKPCFLYFGKFDEDEEISVGNLKRLWVAEGFIRKEKGKSAENIAGEYLMELIDRSLLMIAKRRTDGRGAKSCVVHDLLRDLCLKKSKEESFLKYLNSETIFEKGHRVRGNGESATLSNCQHVRSFAGDHQSSSFYVRDMRLLRVLYFKGIYSRNPFGISYLVNLRFLVIYNLPARIDKLVNLEYVRVEEVETSLPPTIVKMKKLRYLRAHSAEYSKDWKIKKLRYQISYLEYLSGLTIKNAKDEEFLKCWRYLRKLKCIYDVDRWACPDFDLRFLTQLDSLSVDGFLRKDFGFPSRIRKLTLCGSCLPWEKMSTVGRLEFLEVLKLSSDAFQGDRWDTRDGEFRKLRNLQLEDIQLSEWNVASNEHFPKLRQLMLINCLNLQEIPSEIGEITTLELIEVKRGCRKSLVESAVKIKEEQRDVGNEDLRVIISPTSGDW